MMAVLLAAALLTYSNSLSSPFLLDDHDTITHNPHITSLAWPDAFQAPPQSSLAGRPVPSLSMAVSYAMGGLNPPAYRLWNIGVLVAAGLLVFGIVRRAAIPFLPNAGERDWLAFCIALLWLVHPLNTEVVDYVTQRTESMMGLAYLATLYASIRAIEGTSVSARWTWAAVIACALGMASKESMVTAPVMVLLYDAAFVSRSLGAAVTRHRWLYAGLASTWAILLILNLGGPRSGSAGFGTASVATYVLNQAVMIWRYLRLSILPTGLVADYGRTFAIDIGAALPYLAGVVFLIAAVVVAWLREWRLIAFLGTWVFVTLAPSSSIVPIVTEVGAERRMFLASIAIVVLFVAGLRALAPASLRVTVATSLLIGMTLASLSYARNAEYHDPIALWQTVIERHPHGRAHYNKGIELKARGRTAEAIAEYRKAIADEPAAYYALGFEASEAKRPQEAVEWLQEFRRRRPVDPAAPNAGLLLGQAFVDLGRGADAERVLRDTLAMAPSNIDALGTLADAVALQERHEEAIALYRQYLTTQPQAVNARYNLGVTLARSGREAEAVDVFAQLLAETPSNPTLRLSLGTALAAIGRIDDAITQYREALRLAPDSPPVMSGLALALAERGEYQESDQLFQRALQAAPNDPSIRDDHANAAAIKLRRGIR